MSYLILVLTIGYYLYKAFAKYKEEQSDVNLPAPTPAPTAQKKKKSFFDDILEEIEKAQKAQEQSMNVPQQSMVKTQKAKKSKPNKHYSPNKLDIAPLSPEQEGVRVTEDFTFEQVPATTIPKRGFAGMKMSPKDALKAQIILERKF